MDNMLNNTDEILSQQITGFHQYILTPPAHLNYVSQNLCQMLGVCEKDLVDDSKDLYALMVHPADRKKYSEFIDQLALQEQTLAQNTV